MSPGTIRDDFPMLAEWTHLNCGGMAPMPTSVGAELLRVPGAVVREGPLRLLTHDEEFLGIEAARATLARFIGAEPDEVAFTTQFSTAVNIVVEGLDLTEVAPGPYELLCFPLKIRAGDGAPARVALRSPITADSAP